MVRVTFFPKMVKKSQWVSPFVQLENVFQLEKRFSAAESARKRVRSACFTRKSGATCQKRMNIDRFF